MKRIKIFALFVLVIALTAAIFTPVQAAKPSCAGQFVHSHTLYFDPGDWSVGTHTYQVGLTDPYSGLTTFPAITFTVSPSAPLYDGNVEMRFYGVRTADGVITEIHPDQATKMQISWIYEGLTRAEMREVHDEFVAEFEWDGGGVVYIPAEPIISVCAWEARRY